MYKNIVSNSYKVKDRLSCDLQTFLFRSSALGPVGTHWPQT